MAIRRSLAIALLVPLVLQVLLVPVKGRGDPRFSANDSYVGREVPCSYDEKVCLRHNMLYQASKDRCDSLGEGGHSCFLAADRHEFEHGSGHIVGVCRKYDDITCRYWMGNRMALDGRCYAKDLVQATLCGCEGGTTQHLFGGEECRCSPQPPRQVEQPAEEGRCRIPDFRVGRPDASAFYDHPLGTMDFNHVKLSCAPEQLLCFRDGKVHVQGARGCHSLLKQGPCPEDHVVALDGRAAKQRRQAEVTCVHVRGGCPRGQRRMGFDAQCHSARDMDLAAPGAVQINVYGVHEVLKYAVGILYTPKAEGARCVVDFLKMWPFLGRVDLPEAPCTSDDSSHCEFRQIFSTPPPLN